MLMGGKYGGEHQVQVDRDALETEGWLTLKAFAYISKCFMSFRGWFYMILAFWARRKTADDEKKAQKT